MKPGATNKSKWGRRVLGILLILIGSVLGLAVVFTQIPMVLHAVADLLLGIKEGSSHLIARSLTEIVFGAIFTLIAYFSIKEGRRLALSRPKKKRR